MTALVKATRSGGSGEGAEHIPLWAGQSTGGWELTAGSWCRRAWLPSHGALERTAEAGRTALLLLQNCSLAHQLPDIPKNTFFSALNFFPALQFSCNLHDFI